MSPHDDLWLARFVVSPISLRLSGQPELRARGHRGPYTGCRDQGLKNRTETRTLGPGARSKVASECGPVSVNTTGRKLGLPGC